MEPSGQPPFGSGPCPDLRDQYQLALDQAFMAQALAMARSATDRTWPNPPVGALIVQGEEIVGRGTHQGPGQAHAEVVALAQAGDKARGATLYCTLEPCNHMGRTPPCAPAIVTAGLTRVVVAMRDPNPSVSGGGLRHLRDRGIATACGILADDALELIWPFVVTGNFSRPYVELKTATSLDGRFAPADTLRADAAAPFYLTGPDARRDVHMRRRRVDLVLVGEQTVRADNPRLDGRLAADCRLVPQTDPLAGYVDTDLSWTGGFRRDHYLVLAGQSSQKSNNIAALEADGAEIIFCPEKNGHVTVDGLVAAIQQRGVYSVMVEGGPTLAAAFLGAGQVDRWIRYTAPVVLGLGLGWPKDWALADGPDKSLTLTSSAAVGEDLVSVFDRLNFASTLARVTV